MRTHHARHARVGAHRRPRRRATLPVIIMLVVAGSVLTGATAGATGGTAAPMMHYHGRATAMHYHGRVTAMHYHGRPIAMHYHG